MKTRKIQKQVYINSDVDNHIREVTRINFSKFVEEAYRKEHMRLSSLYEKEARLEKEINSLKQEIEATKKWQAEQVTQKPQLTQAEVEFFQEASKTIKRNPLFLEGQIKRYNNLFGKKISQADFELYLEKFSERGVYV